MRKLTVEEAIGHSICHDMTAILADGFKGVRFHRGHVITEEDVPVLLSMGKSHVFVWEPEADEVHEDDAAFALASVIANENIAFTGPSEGKFQFTAACAGMLRINRPALERINSVPDYTVAVRPDGTRLAAGEKFAGARIVPLVTKRENVDAAVRIAKENAPVLSVIPFKPLKTGIVITGNEIFHGRIQDRFEPMIRPKLAPYGSDILGVTKVDDSLADIGSAIASYLAMGAELIILSGGMSVDPDDLTPTAIRQTGARVIAHGVPMQPGNMLMMAYLGQTVLMGVPGASLHSPVTSLDVFLPRVFCGEAITESDITKMGSHGFCMGCEVCHYPVCYFGFT